MLYQFLPRLADDEYRDLEASIREHGVQVPIVVDERRAVIDGHHRKEIADRLGIECPRRFAMDLTDEQKRTLAYSLNLHRRHLSREQKRELVEKSLRADPHLSDRRHAERTGASHPTVGKVREELEASGEVESFTTRTGKDGIAQPATKRELTAASGPDEFCEACGADADGCNCGSFTSVDPEPTPAPTARTAPRKPLPDVARDLGQDLRRITDRFERFANDDRLARNKNEVAAHLRHHLAHALKVLTDLEQEINSPKESTS